jgi:hypothetical protein
MRVISTSIVLLSNGVVPQGGEKTRTTSSTLGSHEHIQGLVAATVRCIRSVAHLVNIDAEERCSERTQPCIGLFGC